MIPLIIGNFFILHTFRKTMSPENEEEKGEYFNTVAVLPAGAGFLQYGEENRVFHEAAGGKNG
ncbi:hypothetical protein MKQ70_12960 [Chitinophaga sedimenti]|uniref:hypothetical protein n=1 Tax=Chitinophaga sedimenti TaxID=2033606 RepID=UPI00200301BC|nr:hypothetical protein [Chitinophaga sedimenti]MCK7555877.1 hypothetical protein [Chitinophaga sedimenti]